MPDPIPDQLTAYVARVKEDHRQHVSGNFPAPGICVSRCAEKWPCSSARLAAVVERLLKLAGDWDAKAREIGEQITLQDCDGAVAGFKMIGHQNHRDHAKALREAISAELLGEEKADGSADR